MTPQQAEQLIVEGLEALRRGDSATARDRLTTAIEGKSGGPEPWFLLAQACRHQGDRLAEINALERVLGNEQANVAALLMMGDAKASVSDDRAATSYFKRALGYAAANGNISASLHPMLASAEQWLQSSQHRFADHLGSHLRSKGMTGKQPPRITEALALLLGEKQRYAQEPTVFYLPGLPQRQFYEREDFPWIADMEALVPVMQEELRNIRTADHKFDPYIVTADDRPRSVNPLADNNKWGAWYFWENGKRIADHGDQCPHTMAALNLAPIPVIQNRSPMALYSVLEPDTHIIPHHGALNTRLICHIPLMVPGNCALRCGNETREWREGEALIFDDSFEHEAWNRSTDTRIILLFDIWRPEISDTEKEALVAIFEAVDAYGMADISK